MPAGVRAEVLLLAAEVAEGKREMETTFKRGD